MLVDILYCNAVNGFIIKQDNKAKKSILCDT